MLCRHLVTWNKRSSGFCLRETRAGLVWRVRVQYLVKSGGTGVVTKDCMGFLWTCWNMSRISGLLEISSLLLHEWS